MAANAKRQPLPKWNFWLGLLTCVATVLAFIIGTVKLIDVLKDEQQVPLARLNVQGELRQLTQAEIRSALTQQPMGSFFTADVNVLRERVEQLPWVAKASLRKVWPDRLSVYVTERQPVARWNGDRLVTAEGTVFRAQLDETQLAQPLPELFGPEDAVSATLEQFNQVRQMLQVNGIEVRAMRLTERFAVSVMLADQVELKLGREATLERIKRFIDLLPSINEHKNSKTKVLDTVDLRYDTGAAVSWREPENKES
ncbi:cell division protein FtsQ/DivIB [Idiomarina aquatica]|uniref:Cell division protein FtsQ n=1 Tax=Idiomarina aquatica TaxID=1327752 RepID=A0AA94EGA8_9GAMM|nr:cell division protein FtsQ/DivIB [Idiomarina aquatica]RUO45338.1 cell division protein DivIVA [Idiomarina aquatica]